MLFQSLAFLFAAGAIALPIYLHLAKRNKPKQAPFPSLRFVEQAPVPTRRRFIPMHWLLLLLRCLAIILIALAFAQPYFPRSTVPLESKRVLLVDDSYSMQSEGLAAVTRKLNEMIDTASPEEPILIGLVSDHVRWMESFSGNPAGARFWLEENWKKNDVSDFKPAIQQASQQLGSQDLGSREIHVFTDGQLLPWKRFDLDAFQLEPGIELSIHSPDLDHSERANLSVQAVSISEEPAGEKSRYFIDIALKNHSAKLSEGEIEIYFSGQRVSAADFSIEPSGLYQSRARFSGDSFKLQHGHIQVRTNDSLSVDNRRCFSINSRAKPIVFRQPHAEFFDYFGAVFNRGVWANRCEYYDLSDSTHRDKITDASLILLVRGGETLAPEVIAEIERAVKQGATLFISGNQASESFNDFEAIEFLNVKESKGADQFSEIDFSHPIFKSYREMPTRDLRALVFHDTLELERTRESQAVANFAGKPAIVESVHSKGRVITAAFALDPSSTNWPTQPAFVNFALSLLRYANRSHSQSIEYRVSNYPLGIEGIQAAKDADTGKMLELADAAFTPDRPGNYIITDESSEYVISVNLDPSEGQLTALPPDFAYKSWERPEASRQAKSTPVPVALDLDPEIDFSISKWLLVLVICLLVLDFIVANSTRNRMGTQ